MVLHLPHQHSGAGVHLGVFESGHHGRGNQNRILSAAHLVRAGAVLTRFSGEFAWYTLVVMAKEKEKDPVLSMRVAPVVMEQLEALQKKLGENRSRCVVRAIAEAHAKHCEKKRG